MQLKSAHALYMCIGTACMVLRLRMRGSAVCFANTTAQKASDQRPLVFWLSKKFFHRLEDSGYHQKYQDVRPQRRGRQGQANCRLHFGIAGKGKRFVPEEVRDGIEHDDDHGDKEEGAVKEAQFRMCFFANDAEVIVTDELDGDDDERGP